MDSRLGSLVDERYKILESMDSGSMGVVYKAERVPVGKLVALKFLHASYANDSEFLARFERETRVMSKLAHPNCVSVVDFGVWQGTPYLVMEFVAGRTLRKIMDEGALPAVRALALARQIVSGLAHAHAQGITHRDIKPANIMITEEIGTGEHVRILDFGLARLRGAAGRDATQTNVVVGTPNYMAPEQTIGGGIIDERTDIYAVGVVLFEMVTGERPFQAEDTLTLLGMHRATPVPKIADRLPRGAEVPDGLQAVIERAMAKSPDDRFPSAIALAEAIDAMIGRPVAATGPTGYPVARPPAAEPAGTAPTLLDVGARSAVATVITSQRPARERTSEERTVAELPSERAFAQASLARPARRSSSSSRAGILLALLVLGGGAYAAYYVQNRAKAKGPAALEGGALAQVEPEGGGSGGSGSGDTPDQPGSGSAGSAGPAAGSGAAPDQAGPGSSAAAGSDEPPAGAGSGSGGSGSGDTPDQPGSGSAGPAAGSGAGPDQAGQAGQPGPGSSAAAGSDEPPAGAGSGSAGEPGPGVGSGAGEGSGSGAPAGEVENVPSPTEATNPDPVGAGSAEDEDENAPKTQADVEKRVKPAAPVLATTISGAVKLIQDGKRDLALASLQALEQKQSKSAYIAFLLGNLYFDQRWWSVAMDYYRAAIYRNGGYKFNAVLIKNVIRTLLSKKTDKKAEYFLRKTIGRPALPYLQQTARTDSNPYLRKYAGALARQIR